MKRWIWSLAGTAVAMALLCAGGLAVVATGAFDARASTPHDPITAWVTHTTMVHSMRREAQGVHPPAAFTPAETIAGLHLYERQCMVCHGGPGVPRAGWVHGMNPSPPFLLDASRRWSRGQMYWVVKNGVKMTAMPAWAFTDSDGQIWDLVAFLEAMPQMEPADFQRLTKDAGAGEPAAMSTGSSSAASTR